MDYSLADLAQLEVFAARAEAVEWQGHAALRLENGLALIDRAATDFSADVWIGTEGPCYPGIAFRARDDQDFEVVYVQPHTSGTWDAVQYDSAFHGAMTWQLYHGPAYQAPALIPTGRWLHLRLDVQGARVAVAVDGIPTLVINRLAHEVRAGRIGVWTYLPAYFRDLHVGEAVAIPAGGESPAAPPGALGAWDLADIGRVACEPNGTLNLARWLAPSAGAAHLTRHFHLAAPQRVTLGFGFSDRLTMRLDGETVFQGEHTFKGFDAGYEGRGYVIAGDQTLARDLPAGDHTLEADLEAVEPFGWGIALTAPESLHWQD